MLRRKFSFVLSIVAVTATSILVVAPNPSSAGPVCPVGSEFQLLGLVNQFRSSNGRGALTLSSELMVKAQRWSDLLAAENGLRHSNLVDGVSAGWSGIAENVAYNASVAADQAALEASPGHRTNLLGDYSELGLGISCGTGGRIFVSQVFVKRSVPTPSYQNDLRASSFSAVTPARLLDTRGGVKPAALSHLTIPVGGRAGVPDVGVSAAVVAVSAIDGVGVGWLQVGPTGATAFGASSNLNYSQVTPTASATTIVQLGAGGAIELFISESAHVVVDVIGFFATANGSVSAGRTVPIAPVRALDTRPGYSPAYGGPRPSAGSTVTVGITGVGQVPTSGVSAVVANITAVAGDSPGHVVVAPGGGTEGGVEVSRTGRPNQISANLVIIPVDAAGRISLTPTMNTDLLVDVFAWITNGSQAASTEGLFVPTTPIRFLDTRAANGIATTRAVSGNINVDVSARNFYPTCARAVFANITAVSPAQPIWLQAGPAGRFANGAFSNLNNDLAAGIVANSAVIPVGDGCDVGVFASSSTHEILDLSGYFI